MSPKKKETKITPGMNDILKKEASEEEKKAGKTTRVTTLSQDEVEY